MDMPVNVPVDDPNADTEWNDILRKHGVIPEKPPSPTPIIQEAVQRALEQAHENRLENKDLDELDALEDEEDETFLERYKQDPMQQRLAELSTIARASVYNQVYPLQKPDFSRDVTEESQRAFVCVHLASSLGTNTESRLLTELWRELAQKFGDVKFCEMRADLCIEGYPERNTPTVLVYHKGDIVKQVVTLKELGGQSTTLAGLQKLLIEVGAVQENDHRVLPPKRDDVSGNRKLRRGNIGSENSDDDWD